MKKHSVLSLSWHRFFAGLFICFLVIPPPPVSGRFFGFCDGHLGEWLEGDKKKTKMKMEDEEAIQAKAME